jgi:uncharacterized membrane protein
MPFCTQCGTQVQPADVFCAGCGTRQGAAPPPSSGPSASPGSQRPPKPANDVLQNLTGRNASLLCYIPVVGWIVAIIVLASEKFRHEREVRFHAFQSLYLFVLYLFVEQVFSPIARHSESTRFLSQIMQIVVFGSWIFMLVKTSQGENFRLPILGELADRSVSEQR